MLGTTGASSVKLNFKKIVKKALAWSKIQILALFPSHYSDLKRPTQNRLKHTLRVAYLSYLLSKIFHQNPRLCARAGLFHDIGYSRVTPEFAKKYLFDHALAGAQLLEWENEPIPIIKAVRTHMFPFSPRPKTLFSFVIWLADKLDWIFYYTRLDRYLDRYLTQLLEL